MPHARSKNLCINASRTARKNTRKYNRQADSGKVGRRSRPTVTRCRLPVVKEIPGAHSGGATPVPIPNTTVKPAAAMILQSRESSSAPGYEKTPREIGAFWVTTSVEEIKGFRWYLVIIMDTKTKVFSVRVSENDTRDEILKKLAVVTRKIQKWKMDECGGW